MPVQENHVDVKRYRGPVRVCEFCSNATLPLPLRTNCKFCLTRGYVAQCLNCDGTGSKTLAAVWDGGASEHSATCAICGGTGVLPATKPEADQKEQEKKAAESKAPAVKEKEVKDQNVNKDLKKEQAVVA